MRDSFKGYYPPTSEEYSSLWRQATICFDTNVLLELYRLPPVARDEFIVLLEQIKNRVWIPHHVAIEFQMNRLNVISQKRKATSDALLHTRNWVSEIRTKVEELELEKHGLGIDPKNLFAEIEVGINKLTEAIKSAQQAQIDITDSDPIRDKLDSIFAGRTGRNFRDQKELDELLEGAEYRYERRIPPGFLDAEKQKNPNDSEFVHDGIVFPRKFGDLIVWKQLIEYARSSKAAAVLLITSDQKNDWWWREQGETIGPQPQLTREICREADVELFWMYTLSQFLLHAKKYIGATISDQAVEEVRLISRPDDSTSHIPQLPIYTNTKDRSELEFTYPSYNRDMAYEGRISAISKWLVTEGFEKITYVTPVFDLSAEKSSLRYLFLIKKFRLSIDHAAKVFYKSFLSAIQSAPEGTFDIAVLVVIMPSPQTPLEQVKYTFMHARKLTKSLREGPPIPSNSVINVGMIDRSAHEFIPLDVVTGDDIAILNKP